MRSHVKCYTCRFWDVPVKDRETVETGECRRRTPVLGFAEGEVDTWAHWPRVHSCEWCGEHEMALYCTDEGPEDRRALFSKINQILVTEDREVWNRFLADLRHLAMEIHHDAQAMLEPKHRVRKFAGRLREHLVGVPYLEE